MESSREGDGNIKGRRGKGGVNVKGRRCKCQGKEV